MSNIGKITAFVIFICLFLLPIFAEETNPGFEFSIVPSFGMLYGQAKEIVYRDSVSSDFFSELQWNMNPLFYAGLAADFGLVNNFAKHGFVGNLSFKMGIPQRTGIMEDWDWDNIKYWWVDMGDLTNYSRHDNFSERAITADLSLGYSFPLQNYFALGINLDFLYMHFYWIAKDGYYQYLNPGQTWADVIPKLPIDGIPGVPEDRKVLTYTQNWFILSPGVFFKFRLGSYFSLNGNFNYSPLIYCVDRDDHLVPPSRTYFDYLYNGQYLKGSGGITFSPFDYLDLTLFLSYSSITDSRGNIYQNSGKYENQAGAGYSAFDIGLSARFRFFGWH
jgi:outer membrane protease